MSKKPETIFKERVIADLRRLPRTWFTKIQQVAIHGTPDFLICIAGLFIALEIKRDEDAITTQLQQYELRGIKNADGITFVAYPKNWKKVYAKLAKIALSRSAA